MFDPRLGSCYNSNLKFSIIFDPKLGSRYNLNLIFLVISDQKLGSCYNLNLILLVMSDPKLGSCYNLNLISFCHVWPQGQSGQISTVHQKLVTFWNITHMMIWNSLVEPFGVKYERPNLGQARLYIDRVSWPLFSGCHALTFSGFLRIWTRKIIKFLLFLV